MLNWLFPRKQSHLPASSAELAETLRVAAQFADASETALEYTAAADALDRAITLTRRHADAPTRDAFAYALGRAELNLKDSLRELIDVSKDTHLAVQQIHLDMQQQGAAVGELRREFQSFGEDMSGRIGGLEQRMGGSEADRKALHDQIDRHDIQWQEISQRLQAIEQLLEVSNNHDAER